MAKYRLSVEIETNEDTTGEVVGLFWWLKCREIAQVTGARVGTFQAHRIEPGRYPRKVLDRVSP